MHRIKPWLSVSQWRFFRLDDRLLLILIAIIVGNFSGLASVALNRAIEAMVEWLHPLRHYWWAFLLPAAGAAMSSIFLEKIVREGAGHGVPEVIYAVSRYGGLLRFRSSFTPSNLKLSDHRQRRLGRSRGPGGHQRGRHRIHHCQKIRVE